MLHVFPTAQRVAPTLHMPNLINFEADFSKHKDDLARMKKSYSDEFDLVHYPIDWHAHIFVKFSGEHNRKIWEYISQYIAQLGEVSFIDALKVRLFSLYLTRTVFSWFCSLAPSSFCTWNQLEKS